jgi:hypothetical protein
MEQRLETLAANVLASERFGVRCRMTGGGGQ